MSNISISFECSYLSDHSVQVEALGGLLQFAVAIGAVGQQWET